MRVKLILTFAFIVLAAAAGAFIYAFVPKLYANHLLAKAGIEVSSENFVDAACRDDAGTVLLMLNAGINVNAKASTGMPYNAAERTALYCAASSGDVKLASLLIDRGASIEEPGQDHETALFAAIRPGFVPYRKPDTNFTMVGALLAKGANINAKSDNGTILHIACRTGNAKLIEYLLDHGANPAIADSHGMPPVVACTANAYMAAQIPFDRLMVKGVNLNAVGPDGMTLLSRAAQSGNVPLAQKLLELGASPDAPDTSGDTPLIHAAANLQILKLLAEKGADLNIVGRSGTALMAALRSQQMDAVGYLLSKGANATLADQQGNTPLHIAAFSARTTPAITMLIAAGAQPNAINLNGDTPLHIAASYRNQPGVDALLAHGAKTNIKNYAGQTPLALSRAGAQPVPIPYGGGNYAIAPRFPAPLGASRQAPTDIEKTLKQHGAKQ